MKRILFFSLLMVFCCIGSKGQNGPTDEQIARAIIDTMRSYLFVGLSDRVDSVEVISKETISELEWWENEVKWCVGSIYLRSLAVSNRSSKIVDSISSIPKQTEKAQLKVVRSLDKLIDETAVFANQLKDARQQLDMAIAARQTASVDKPMGYLVKVKRTYVDVTKTYIMEPGEYFVSFDLVVRFSQREQR
jgi:hypothetical protein